MSTALIRNPNPVITEFDELLDRMIGLQKKEQELILARRTDDLAATTQSIEWMGLKMQSMEIDVRRELEESAKRSGEKDNRVQEKLAQIRRLALQNRTLLEHSLFFLQQLFQQVLERDTPLHLYNLNGHAFRSDLGGGLLETRI
jgi:flagellar biosynthesis/type III secretory pathway chaperone